MKKFTQEIQDFPANGILFPATIFREIAPQLIEFIHIDPKRFSPNALNFSVSLLNSLIAGNST
jgi:hypothetical protein